MKIFKYTLLAGLLVFSTHSVAATDFQEKFCADLSTGAYDMNIKAVNLGTYQQGETLDVDKMCSSKFSDAELNELRTPFDECMKMSENNARGIHWILNATLVKFTEMCGHPPL